MTHRDEHQSGDTRGDSTTPKEERAPESFDPNAGGMMGGGASGPRDMPTGGRDEGELEAADADRAGSLEQTGGWGSGTQGSSNVAAQRDRETGQPEAPADKGREEIENYGSRREDEDDRLLSPSSQIGRAAQTGGTPEAGRQPDESSREGWSMPDQSDTPEEWPDPTTDS